MSDLTLSAVDFLGLATQRRIARIDLAEVGYKGVVYACDLSTAKQQKVLTRPQKGKTRIHADKSMDINWADLPADAGPKFVAECLVTDMKNGRLLKEAFVGADKAGESFIIWPEDSLVFMAKTWQDELGNRRKVLDKLGDMPNAITNLIVKTVREISGMDEDALEREKKD